MLDAHGVSARVVMVLLGSTPDAIQKDAARLRDVGMAETFAAGCTLGCFELDEAEVQAEGGRVQSEDEGVEVRRRERTSLGFARSPATSGRLGK